MHQKCSLCGISTAPKYMVVRNAGISDIVVPQPFQRDPTFVPIIKWAHANKDV
jgi:hypothetical protein